MADAPDFLNPGGVFRGDSIHFFGVITGALLPSGDVVVVTTGNSEVIFLEPGGEIREVLGGAGEGPHEFRSAPVLVRSGAKLFLVEHGVRRVRELGASSMGEPRPFQADRWQSLVAVFQDDVAVISPHGLAVGRQESEYTEVRPVTPYVLSAGGGVDTLFGPPSPPVPAFPFHRPDGFLSVFIPGASGCLPANHYGVRDEALLIADASTGVMVALDRRGGLDTIFQSDRRANVTREMVDGALAYLQRVDAQGSSQAFLGRVGEVGDPLPATWSDAIWSEEAVWLRHASPCFVAASEWPQLWDVIDLEEGLLVAIVEIPADLRLLAVAADRVLAALTDDLGVRHVGVYRLHQGEAR